MTAWFTFGQSHAHSVNGFTFDKDVVVEITVPHNDPSQVMFATFGDKWAMQYNEKPDMRFYPRGIKKLP